MDDNWGHRCASNLLILQQEVKKERERERRRDEEFHNEREREKVSFQIDSILLAVGATEEAY